MFSPNLENQNFETQYITKIIMSTQNEPDKINLNIETTKTQKTQQIEKYDDLLIPFLRKFVFLLKKLVWRRRITSLEEKHYTLLNDKTYFKEQKNEKSNVNIYK